jgi:hypothetical protein
MELTRLAVRWVLGRSCRTFPFEFENADLEGPLGIARGIVGGDRRASDTLSSQIIWLKGTEGACRAMEVGAKNVFRTPRRWIRESLLAVAKSLGFLFFSFPVFLFFVLAYDSTHKLTNRYSLGVIDRRLGKGPQKDCMHEYPLYRFSVRL